MAKPTKPKNGGVSHLIRTVGHQTSSALGSSGDGNLIVTRADGSQAKIFDILSYIEAPWGLGLRLYPVQRFLVKLYYNLPLSDKLPEAKNERIQITDMFRTKVLHTFTEVEYLHFLYNEGRCNIGVQDHMRRQLILPIGRRGGKCIEEGSLVLTEGGIRRIESLGEAPEEGFSPIDLGIVQEAGRRSRAEAFYNGGVKPTFKVRTSSGYAIGGTGNHRVKVMTPAGVVDWRYLDEIQVGDFVCMNRSTDLWAPIPLDLRPYHNTDGTKDVSLPNELDERVGNLMGYLVGESRWGCEASAFALGLGCNQDTIPWGVLQSPRSVVCAFLRGLFETLGGMTKGQITLTTRGTRLSHEVQVVLLNLGIIASVCSESSGAVTLTVLGARSRRLFADLVGFDSEEKCRWLKESVEASPDGGVDTEKIPHQQPGITSEELLRLDYFYDPVVSVEHGECQVYDLTVPDGKSFVANGMTNHNTTLSAIFASYELYRLLSLHSPQAYYGLPPGNRIQIISVATDKDQAGLLFNDVTAHLAKCEYFKPYIANNTLSYVQFRTPADIEKYGPSVRHQDGKFTSFNGKASIRITFKASVSKGLRGSGNIVIILDEMAHFQDKGSSSAKDIYDAITPSAMAFAPKDPNDSTQLIGPVESRIIGISSPLNKAGKFYELFHFAMSRGEGSEGMLAIQAPTWEINPTVSPEFLRGKFHEDPDVFMTEFGAQFSDSVRGWMKPREILLECIKPAMRPKTQGSPRAPHQMGLDVGLIGDGTTMVISHCEGQDIHIDYHEAWYAGIPWKESNPHLDAPLLEYARNLENVDRLDFDEISNWIAAICKRFYITAGIFDAWNGVTLEQSLHKKGLKQFRMEHFTRDLNSRIYQATKLLMWEHRIAMYDWPLPKEVTAKHSPLVEELLGLQARTMAKNQVIVEAPQIAGSHDDLSDAFVRSIWLSLQKIANQKVSVPRIERGGAPSGPSLRMYQMNRMRSHGVFRDRLVPAALRRR